MGESAHKGTFFWHEINTPDPAGAKSFYTDLIGWGTNEMDMGGGTYTMFTNGGHPIAGCFPLNDEKYENIPVHWEGYIGTDDCDRDAAKVTELGGNVIVPPTDIPGVGRFFTFIDPTGAHCSMYTPSEQG